MLKGVYMTKTKHLPKIGNGNFLMPNARLHEEQRWGQRSPHEPCIANVLCGLRYPLDSSA